MWSAFSIRQSSTAGRTTGTRRSERTPPTCRSLSAFLIRAQSVSTDRLKHAGAPRTTRTGRATAPGRQDYDRCRRGRRCARLGAAGSALRRRGRRDRPFEPVREHVPVGHGDVLSGSGGRHPRSGGSRVATYAGGGRVIAESWASGTAPPATHLWLPPQGEAADVAVIGQPAGVPAALLDERRAADTTPIPGVAPAPPSPEVVRLLATAGTASRCCARQRRSRHPSCEPLLGCNKPQLTQMCLWLAAFSTATDSASCTFGETDLHARRTHRRCRRR